LKIIISVQATTDMCFTRMLIKFFIVFLAYKWIWLKFPWNDDHINFLQLPLNDSHQIGYKHKFIKNTMLTRYCNLVSHDMYSLHASHVMSHVGYG